MPMTKYGKHFDEGYINQLNKHIISETDSAVIDKNEN